MGLDIRGYYGVKLVGIREATDEEARPLWGSVYCRWMEVFGWAAANDGIVVQS